MSNLAQRLDRIERETNAQELGDAELVAGWQRLIEAGNARAIELHQIAKQRRDAAQGGKNESCQTD